MQGILLQVRYFERKLSKSLKKDNFIFLLNLMSSACHSNVIRMSCHSYVIRMYLYITPMSLVCTRMPFVCHSYIIRMSLVYHPYVTRLSLVCTRMLSVCHSYVLVCHPYVTCLWFYHESFISISQTELQRQPPEVFYIKLKFREKRSS